MPPLNLPITTRPSPARIVAAACAVTLLVGCAQSVHALDEDVSLPTPTWAVTPAGALPLPSGWSTHPPTPFRGQRRTPPLWGVPQFEPPQARHCARRPLLSEDGGRAKQPVFHRLDGTRSERAHASPGDAMRLDESTRESKPSVGHAERETGALQRGATEQLDPDWRDRRHLTAPVTAGMVDDNADFAAYLAFRRRHPDASLRNRDLSERYRVEVRDALGAAVPDAELALSWPGAREAVLWARTDAAGSAWLHPGALLAPQTLSAVSTFEVQARNTDGHVTRTALQRGQKASVAVQFHDVGTRSRHERTPLDLVFMVDATGSMADEIEKLRSSMKSMAGRIAELPGGIDLCFGLVAYRDHGEEYLTRTYDLSNDLNAFQGVLGAVRANAGGDEPEAVNEALERTVHRVSWRGAGTSRLVVMIGDAPPHMDYGAPYYDQSAAAALARGIKVHTVGTSGLNKLGEAVFRSIAQSTGGRFVFLTYKDARRPGRGPGSETTHDVRDYSVSTLDDLIVRLVRDEVDKRRGG